MTRSKLLKILHTTRPPEIVFRAARRASRGGFPCPKDIPPNPVEAIRLQNCPLYDKCLHQADISDWESFSCHWCARALRGLHQKIRFIERDDLAKAREDMKKSKKRDNERIQAVIEKQDAD